ncbi:hypothetical protein PEC311524_33710 [Pectobacterium carotovorum subsp. carotovorum]|nr:hypothetical protein PEC311524_33710 [Pectobacterium carotovorum subsp. carotovorum]
MWGTPVPPEGWLELNGQPFNPSGNPVLASLYPSSQVPDFRGYFPRGWDNGAGVDPDSRTILSVQEDAIRNLTGEFQTIDYSGYKTSGVFSPVERSGRAKIGGTPQDWSHSKVQFDASRSVPTANENRPKNIAVMFIIKAG